MRFTHLTLQNWRNFKKADVPLERRVFLVGPNAAGKSNLLDGLLFLRDLADPKRGFQWAVEEERKGVSRLRSLHARTYSSVEIDVRVELDDGSKWRYRLEFNQDKQRRAFVQKEEVWRGDVQVLQRPDSEDRSDRNRLTQTALEQVNANRDFRPLASAFSQIRYLHLIPQLIRDSRRSVGMKRDPFGEDFLEQLASMQRARKRTFDSRMGRVERALQMAVPQLSKVTLTQDVRGVPHLEANFKHWRARGAHQDETQFSDGTIRLLGLLWGLMDGTGPLLLEEPELSLHQEIVRYLPAMMSSVIRKSKRQILVSTHSEHMFLDEGVSLGEVILLNPTENGTDVSVASSNKEIAAQVEHGALIGEAVFPWTAPSRARQLPLMLTE